MWDMVCEFIKVLLIVEAVIGVGGTIWVLTADRALSKGRLGEGWEVPVNIVLTVVLVMVMWPFVVIHWLEQRGAFRRRIR